MTGPRLPGRGVPSAQEVLDYIRFKFFKSAGRRELELVKSEEQNVQCSGVTTSLEEECSPVIEPGPQKTDATVGHSDRGNESIPSAKFADALRKLEMGETTPLSSRLHTGADAKGMPSPQDILSSISSSYLRKMDPSTPEMQKTDATVGHSDRGNESIPSAKFADALRKLEMGETTPLSSRLHTGADAKGIPSLQNMLSSISSSYLRKIDPSTTEDFNNFVRYMQKVRQVLICDTKLGSLIITGKCSSLEILDELWKAHCTGSLNKMAQSLVTDDVLKTFGLTEVKLRAAIVEEEYEACREVFLKERAGGYILWILSHFFPQVMTLNGFKVKGVRAP